MATRKNSPYNQIEREFTLVGRPLPSDELEVEMPQETPMDMEGMEITPLEDGGVQLGPPEENAAPDTSFTANLAINMSDDELAGISSMVLEKVEEDKNSRSDWMSTYTKGLELLPIETKFNEKDSVFFLTITLLILDTKNFKSIPGLSSVFPLIFKVTVSPPLKGRPL